VAGLRLDLKKFIHDLLAQGPVARQRRKRNTSLNHFIEVEVVSRKEVYGVRLHTHAYENLISKKLTWKSIVRSQPTFERGNT
jgi:hypothetical protein